EVQRDFALGWKWRFDQSQAWRPTGDLASSVPPQGLFVERCLSLARPGGRPRLGAPPGRAFHKPDPDLLRVPPGPAPGPWGVGRPEPFFKPGGRGGRHPKTCLITLTGLGDRVNGSRRGKVFMAEAKWCGKDSRAREIPNDDLPAIGDNFATFKGRKKLVPSRL